MDLRRTGSEDELVCIETDHLSLMIKGTPVHPYFQDAEFQEKEARISVRCNESFCVALADDAYKVAEQYLRSSYVGVYQLRPLFFEQQNYEILIEQEGNHRVEFWHDNYNIRKKVTPISRNRNMLTGTINFGNEVGYSDFIVRVDGKEYLKLTLEVFPSKISYKEDYKAIVNDITDEVYNLIFDFLKKTYESYDISSTQNSSLTEFFAIIRKIYGRFITAADMILRNPHHQLQTEHEVLPWYKVKRTDNQSLRWIEKHPEYVRKTDGGIKAERALAAKKYVTYDTKENRITKYMLEQTMRRLSRFKSYYTQLDRKTDEEVIKQIDSMINGINRRINTGFMKDVDSSETKLGMSLVFGMAPGYRELYRCYLLLQHGLSVTGSIFNISLKDLAALYEYWCFIKLNSLMKEKYKLISQDIIRASGNGLTVSLVKGHRSTVKYKNPENGELITLSYNPKEINVPTGTQRPDNVLKLEKKGAVTDYEYVFDAKYKVNPALPNTDYGNYYKTPGPQIDDINTMHRYRDAIVYQNDASPYERTMFGAYVLFPYQKEEEYKDHQFYTSIEKVNIGGLPFLPSATSLVAKMLDELISDSSDSAFERATLPVGIESRLAKVDWNKRDVMVGTLEKKEDLDICLNNGFFYVPASRINEEDFPIHYVAIYETRKLFGADAKIQHYGEVKSYSLVKRSAFPELSGDSDELYYRFNIKSWKKLNKAITPKERGFSNLFTNLFLLQHSAQIPELFLRSEEEYRFYTELKRRTDATVINEDNPAAGFELGENKVLFDDGQIILNINGIEVEKQSIMDFSKHPNAVFRKFMNNLQKK